MDVKQVGRELGVRYILEGSVRKAGDEYASPDSLSIPPLERICGQTALMAALDDIFDLQDQVTASVVGAIAPKLEQAEIERTKRKPTESLDAYDYYLRGLATVNQVSREAADTAFANVRDGRRASMPDFTLAYAHAAWCYTSAKDERLDGHIPRKKLAEAERLARNRAVELGRDDAAALCFWRHCPRLRGRTYEDGVAFVGRALALNPNLAAAWFASGWFKLCRGEVENAIQRLHPWHRLQSLSIHTGYAWQTDIAMAHFCAGRYSEAVQCAEEALRDQPSYAYAFRVSCGQLMQWSGRLSDAQKSDDEVASSRSAASDEQLSRKLLLPLNICPEHRARYIEGLASPACRNDAA